MELRVPAAAQHVGRCRHWVAYMARMHGAGVETERLVELLTSEVATGAIAAAEPGSSLVVTLQRIGSRLVVDVEHTGAPTVLGDARHPELGQPLTVLAGSGVEWGARSGEGQRSSLWFEVPTSSGAADGRPAGS